MQDCSHFETCSAPLCPLDNKTLHKAIWYPAEEICHSQKYGNTPWVKQQRKIAKATRNLNTFYNYRMLKHNCIVARGMIGLDPDTTDYYDEKAVNGWLIKHPEKKPLSEEKLAKCKELAKMGLKARGIGR